MSGSFVISQFRVVERLARSSSLGGFCAAQASFLLGAEHLAGSTVCRVARHLFSSFPISGEGVTHLRRETNVHAPSSHGGIAAVARNGAGILR